MRVNKCRKEEEGYAIVENMLILPVVFLVVFALLFAGCILHVQCTLESAARRGVVYAGKLICDPQFLEVTKASADPKKGKLTELATADFNFTSKSSIQPYRYIPILNGNYFSNVEANTKNYVQDIISQSASWMFTIDGDDVVCNAKNYVITQQIKVKVTAKYKMPYIFQLLGLPETYDLSAEAVTTVSDQDEFIRNIDYVGDLLERYEVGEKINKFVGEPLQKLKKFTDKFFKK